MGTQCQKTAAACYLNFKCNIVWRVHLFLRHRTCFIMREAWCAVKIGRDQVGIHLLEEDANSQVSAGYYTVNTRVEYYSLSSPLPNSPLTCMFEIGSDRVTSATEL